MQVKFRARAKVVAKAKAIKKTGTWPRGYEAESTDANLSWPSSLAEGTHTTLA